MSRNANKSKKMPNNLQEWAIWASIHQDRSRGTCQVNLETCSLRELFWAFASKEVATQGPKKRQTNYAIVALILVFLMLFNAIWGCNYSKIANYRFLIDCDTFAMLFWTSTILTFFGPVVDPWAPHYSWVYFKHIRTIWEDPWTILIFISENLKIREFSNYRKP